jgi:solute carrier family 25 S-adenosylmethionine transporter 26
VGALAGAVTGVLTTPLDVIKTRMMTQGVSGRYSSILDCATKIAKEEGAAAFLKVRARACKTDKVACTGSPDAGHAQGWEPRVLWIGIGGCVFFTALEEAKKLYAPRPRLVTE